MAYSGRTVESLTSLSLDYVIKNLGKYLNHDCDTLKLMPPQLKDRMVHKFTLSSYFWTDVNFKRALTVLLHPMIQRIDLSLAVVDDEVLEVLKDCYNLRYVYLTRDLNNCFTSQGLINFISALKKLYLLQISNSSAVTDDVLRCISRSCPALAGLDLNGCTNVTDAGIQEISMLKNLQWLTFSSTQVSNNGIQKLASGASGLNLKELRLANCKHITSNILQIITRYCPNIEVLVFYNLQSCENEDYQMYFPLEEGSLKNLKQLTWTVKW